MSKLIHKSARCAENKSTHQATHSSEYAQQPFRPEEYNEVKAWLCAFPSPTDFLHFFATKLKMLHKENENTLQLVEKWVRLKLN